MEDSWYAQMPGRIYAWLTTLHKEFESREIELKDDDPDAVVGMLRYIYGLDPFEAIAAPGVLFDLRLYEVAGKYLMPKLLTKAVQSAKQKLEANWNSPSFTGYVYAIYQQTPSHGGELRNVVKDICRDYLVELLAKKEFKEVFLSIPELSLSIMQRVALEDKMFGRRPAGRWDR